MRGVPLLAIRHALAHPAQTIVLALCVALTVALPLTTRSVVARYRADLTARAAATPLVAGAKGHRFDLTLAALYFRDSTTETVPFGLVLEINDSDQAVAIPISRRFTARQSPIVGVGAEYFPFRALEPATGTLPKRLGDAVLGHTVARQLELGPGDHLFSDQLDAYDIARPPALKMRITGVLEPTGTPDDTAVFVDIKTVWILEGAAHGHNDATETTRDDLVMAANDDHKLLSPAVHQYNEVTPQNAASFHVHGDENALPLTGVILLPADQKQATLLTTRYNLRGPTQIINPTHVVDELLTFVVRIRSLVDAIAAVLALVTTALIALVLLLSVRVRRDEIETLHRIGCAKTTVLKLFALETGAILLAGIALAVVVSQALVRVLPGIASV